MEWVAMTMFALALSLDGFGAGVAYGLRNIAIPWLSLTVICLASMTLVASSMVLGRGIAVYLSPHVAGAVGAVILVIIGVGIIIGALKPVRDERKQKDYTLLCLNIRPLGIIIQIMKEPGCADFDASGEISAREAFFLGLALAMDAMAAGLGVAMTGYNIVITALMVGIAEFLMVKTGLVVGKTVTNGFLKKTSTVVAGLILVSLGLLKIV